MKSGKTCWNHAVGHLPSSQPSMLKNWGFEGVELPSGLQHLHVPSALRCWLWIYKWKFWNIVTCGFYLGKTVNVSKWVRQAKSWFWEGFIKQYLWMFYIAFTISSINFHIHINWTCHLRADGRTSNSNSRRGESTLFTQLRGLDFAERYLGIGLWFLASKARCICAGLPKVKPCIRLVQGIGYYDRQVLKLQAGGITQAPWLQYWQP